MRGEGGKIDGVWNRRTMFSKLAKWSTRMQVNNIFKQLIMRTFVIVLDILSKFSEIGNVSSSDVVYDVNISWTMIIFHWARMIISVWEKLPKFKEKTLNKLGLWHHRSIQENTPENSESVKQYNRIVWASIVFLLLKLPGMTACYTVFH